MSAFFEWNLEILARLAEGRTAFFDRFFSLLTWFGSEYIIIVVVTLFFLCFNKKLAFKMGIAFFVSSAIVQFLKIGCRIERPWVLVKNYPQLIDRYSPLDMLGSMRGATGYSFPSGHTQSALSLYGVLGLSVRKVWAKIAFFAMAVAVAFSRLYLGVHTPFDVIVSFVLTLLLIIACEVVFEKMYDNRKADAVISVVVALVSLGAIVYCCALYAAGAVKEFDMVADCVKMASCGIGFAISFLVDRGWLHFEPESASVKRRIIRMAVGIAGVFVLKEGLKYLGVALFGEELIAVDILRYFLMIVFIVIAIPATEKWLASRKQRAH